MFSGGENLASSVLNSFSESKSKQESKFGRLPSMGVDVDLNGLLSCESSLISQRSCPRFRSSSPE